MSALKRRLLEGADQQIRTLPAGAGQGVATFVVTRRQHVQPLLSITRGVCFAHIGDIDRWNRTRVSSLPKHRIFTLFVISTRFHVTSIQSLSLGSCRSMPVSHTQKHDRESEVTPGAGIDIGKGDKIHRPLRARNSYPHASRTRSTRYIPRHAHGLSLDLITKSYDAVREVLD